MLLVLVSCGSSSSTNVTAPTTAQCAVTLASNSLNMGASGGDGALTIAVNRECSWTARPDVDWITLTSTPTGQGGATINFRVAANPASSSRRGSIGVNDHRVDVTQAGSPCTYSLSRTSDAIDAAGGNRAILVTAGASCPWTAKSNAAWITITGGASGTGNGTVSIDVAPNTGLERSGTVVIAGQIYTLSQTAAGAPVPECTFSLSSTSQSIAAAGGPVSLTVLAGGGCEWTATSHAPWLTITAGASGAGDGTVGITVAANGSSAARTGTATIAGQTFTVTQSGVSSTPCTYSLSASSQSVGASSTTGSIGVTTGNGCAWSATANVPWLSITAGASGTGNGTVQFSVAANPDQTPRAGTLTVAGQTFTVNQDAASVSCSFSLSSTSVSAPAAAGSSSVDITTTSSCAWTAVANASWLTLTSAASGTGNATVSFSIAENADTSSRSGTLTIAGQTVTVSQDPAPPPTCTITLSQSAFSVGAGKADRSVNVTASTPSCAWTASSDVSWITFKSAASGTGNGKVDFHIDANPDKSPRTGTLTISGKTVTVTQNGT